MGFTEELEIILKIAETILRIATIYIVITWGATIKNNTTHIRESLDYIIDRIEQSAADNTLDEIEEELSALREELNDTRR